MGEGVGMGGWVGGGWFGGFKFVRGGEGAEGEGGGRGGSMGLALS